MRQVRCWVCNNWTAEDLIEMMDFDGSQAPVCFECAQNMEVRDKKIRAMRRTRNVTPSGGGSSLASQLAPGGSGQASGGAVPEGAGSVDEPVGEGAAQTSGAVARATQCATAGCTSLAVHSQMWRGRKEGKFGTTFIRRCEVHKFDKEGIDPTWVLEAISTTA